MITLVYAYYENPGMLLEQLRAWTEYNMFLRSDMQIIIVDDGSPRNPAADVIRRHQNTTGMRLRVFRIHENIPWNQDGARNLGMYKADTKYAMLADMDLVLYKDEMEKMLHFACHEAVAGEYYMPARLNAQRQPLPAHPNSYLFRCVDFWKMGGYDEDFAGCYGSDGNFRKCARAVLREVQTSAWALVMYGRSDIPDASTTDFGRKDSKYWRPNFPHLEAKRRAQPYKATNPLRFTWREETL